MRSKADHPASSDKKQQMAERPILFSAPMVRALLDGTKTQTRRVMKLQPGEHHWQTMPGYALRVSDPVACTDGRVHVRFAHTIPQNPQWDKAGDASCPYGKPGDNLWVRETWQGPLLEEFEVDADADWFLPSHIHQYQNPAHCVYAADGGPAPEFTDADDNQRQGWRPSIHMNRWASRITLEITGVRVECLQDISRDDAMAEGIVVQRDGGFGLADTTHYHFTDPCASYWSLWEAINGPGSVEANPWVWVIEFKVMKP